MKKTELVEKVAASAGLTKVQAEAAINAFVETITDAFVAEDKISIKGFGTFETRHRDARVGHNPATKQKIEIPASKVPAFKPSASLKAIVNEK